MKYDKFLASLLARQRSSSKSGWIAGVGICVLGMSACFPLMLSEGPSGSTSEMGQGGSSTTGTGGSNGTTGIVGTTGTGGSGGAPTTCTASDQCPIPSNQCMTKSCIGGICTVGMVADGTATDSQLYGDCRMTVCDGMGGTYVAEDITDIFDDNKECTVDFCDMGVPANYSTAPGTMCGTSGYCNSGGECVACVVSNQCGAAKTCKLETCVPTSCANSVKDPGETDVDCGGACTPCGTSKTCQLAGDCMSGVCKMGSCVAFSCSDGVANGDETGKDCGGSCSQRCASGTSCLQAGDCASGVCKAAVCQFPTCSDGVQNSNESGIDCGGACSHTCT